MLLLLFSSFFISKARLFLLLVVVVFSFTALSSLSRDVFLLRPFFFQITRAVPALTAATVARIATTRCCCCC